MASSRNKSRNRGKRPTATIDVKATDVSEKVDASKVLSSAPSSAAPKPEVEKTPATPPASGTASASVKNKPASSTTDKSSDKSVAASAKGDKAADAKASKGAASAGAKVSEKDTPAKKSGGGGMGGAITHLLAGGVGGLIAFAGFTQFQGQGSGISSSTDMANGSAVISAALETRLNALEQKTSVDPKVEIPAKLESRIKSLETLNTKLASLSEAQNKLSTDAAALTTQMKTLADPAGGGTVELRQRLDSMEGTITSLAKSAEGADGKSIPQLAALAGRMNDLRTELSAKIAATQKATFGEVEKRFATVDTALKATVDDKSGVAEVMETLKGGNQRLSLALETARTETTRLAKDVTVLRTEHDETTTTLGALKKISDEISNRIAKLESTTTENISALPSQDDIAAAITPVTEKLSAMEEQVDGVLKREATRAASAKNILLSLELANLQRALDQGRPIASEVASIKKIAPEGMDLSVFDKLAENKVPSQDELVREFSSVASEAIQAETLNEDASAFDKLFANARSIVRVRKTGDIEGDTTEAVIARAEENLKRNDLKAAVTELGALKDKAAATTAKWIAKANDRLSLDAALAQIEAGLKSSVSSSATN